MKSLEFPEPDDGTADWCLRKMTWDWDNLPASLAHAIILKEDEMNEPRKSVTDEGYVSVPTNWAEEKKKWQELNGLTEKGMKFSDGKPKWQYMAPLWPAMTEVVKVLSRGAEKYEENNWMEVDRDEYIRAIMSHYTAYASGETTDPDMGSHHLANLICSALFLLWHDGIK